MERETITQEVIALLVELTDYKGLITGETRLWRELDLDSLDRAELSCHVEDAFGIHMRAHWRDWRTVDDVVDTVMELHGKTDWPLDDLSD